eukprot:6491886-Amphidinium_carterae.2
MSVSCATFPGERWRRAGQHNAEHAECVRDQALAQIPEQCMAHSPWQASEGPPPRQGQDDQYGHACPRGKSAHRRQAAQRHGRPHRTIGVKLGRLHRHKLLSEASEGNIKGQAQTNGSDGNEVSAVRGRTCPRALSQNILFRRGMPASEAHVTQPDITDRVMSVDAGTMRATEDMGTMTIEEVEGPQGPGRRQGAGGSQDRGPPPGQSDGTARCTKQGQADA